MLGVIDDEVAGKARRDDQRRDPRAGAPLVIGAGRRRARAGRRDVIPLTAELVVRDDHHRVLGARRPLDRLQQGDEVVAAPGLARVAGVLVLFPDRLDEADLLQVAVVVRRVGVGDELGLVLEMRCARVRAGPVVVVVVERLVVVLEVDVRAARPDRVRPYVRVDAVRAGAVRPAGRADVAVGVRPATRVPGPVDALGGQLVADVRAGQGRQPLRVGRSR